jgi:hypothetical protein
MYSLDSSDTRLHCANNKQSWLGMVPNRMLVLPLDSASLNIAAPQFALAAQMELHSAAVVAFEGIDNKDTLVPLASAI